MLYTVENIQEGIAAKLKQLFNDEIDSNAASTYFNKLITYPKEIEQNILEWIDNRAYKFRLYPNVGQIVLINKTFGCVRFIYNNLLSDKPIKAEGWYIMLAT